MEIDALKVKILLAEQKKTQVKLADECEVTRQILSRVLRKGRCNPITAGKIASGLGVSVTDILKEVQ
jgi:DNA-binding Xre family transcriptional regulator